MRCRRSVIIMNVLASNWTVIGKSAAHYYSLNTKRGTHLYSFLLSRKTVFQTVVYIQKFHNVRVAYVTLTAEGARLI